MKIWFRRISLIALVIASCGISYWVGNLNGKVEGYSKHLLEDASTQAYSDVVVLENLRKGENEKAIRSIESRLDSEILKHGLWLESDPSHIEELEYSDKANPSRKAMLKVAKYRQQYPSANPDAKIRHQIEAVLKYYTSDK